MKRPSRFLYLFIFIVCSLSLFCVNKEPAVRAQTSAPPPASAMPSTPAAQKEYTIPIIQLPDRPPAKPEDTMNMLDPTAGHAEPAAEYEGARSLNFPEMVDDGKGGIMVARAKESFSKLTLEDSVLVAQEPVFGGREVTPTFIRELWQLRWRPNDPIDFYIILPRHVMKPPVVLYLYGYPNDTDRFKNNAFCTRITQRGAAAIGFVSALTGQRYVFRPFKNWFVSELPESLSSTVHDVQMILNQIQTRQDLDLSRIAMFGQGSGATIALMAAAVDPRIKTLDLLDPWGDWPDWFAKSNAFPEKERSTYLNPDFLKSLQPLEPLNYLPSLKDRDVRIQFVKQSGEPEEAVKKLAAAAPANAKVNQYDTNHEFYEAYNGGQLFFWLADQLRAKPGNPGDPDTATQQAAK